MSAGHSRLAGYVRRSRATKQEMRSFRDALVEIVTEIKPCTVRQIFYQTVVRGLVEKNEREYGRVQEALVWLREAGEIPWNHIVDSTRTLRRPDTWADPAAALESAARHYRKAIWADSEVVPEVWLEKEALVGVIWDVTDEWDVGLYTSRGYASLPFVHDAAATIATRWEKHGKATAIYHLGDFDPSGRDAARAIRERLARFVREMVFEDDLLLYGEQLDVDIEDVLADVEEIFTFTELAVTPRQIQLHRLPLRPTKTTDTRARRFAAEHGDVGGSVELDAMHPDVLRALVRSAIGQHMPAEQVEALRVVEAEEREGLKLLARQMTVRGAA
jgi:hypothetical protein